MSTTTGYSTTTQTQTQTQTQITTKTTIATTTQVVTIPAPGPTTPPFEVRLDWRCGTLFINGDLEAVFGTTLRGVVSIHLVKLGCDAGSMRELL
jgi:hypothetical protein